MITMAIATYAQAPLPPGGGSTKTTQPSDIPPTGGQGGLTSSVKMVGIGGTNILDTYLSAEKYHGTEIRYLSHTTRSTRVRNFTQILIHQGDLSLSGNRADNNDEMAGMYNFQYAWRYNRNFLGSRLHVEAGAGIDFNLGFIYNLRNGNNPAQAKASLNIAPSAAVAYDFNISRHKFQVRYEVMAPLAGLMFSPNYGQSYYEIFNKGDYDHNIVPTTFVSAPSLRHMVSLDFPLWHTWFRIGYLGDFQQAKVNNLKYHTYSNMFMIGVVRHFSIIKNRP